MSQPLRALALTALLTCSAAAWGQKATEIYIPVGQSPGLSGKHTLMGRIQSLNPADRSMTVTDAAGAATTVRLNPQAQLWLDRSKLKQPNRKADYADYRQGMAVEVKYVKNERNAGVVEWVKVQAVE